MTFPGRLIPYFPRLRLLPGRGRVTPVLNIPTLAVRPYDLPVDPLANFTRNLFGSRESPARVPDLMRQMAREHREQFQQGLGGAVLPLVEAALGMHSKNFGLDPSKWSDGSDAQRAAYTVDLAPPEGGHAAALVTFEALANPGSAVADPNLMRCLAGAFPGQFAAIPDDLYLRMLEAGRRPDGTLDDVLAESWERIKAYNAKEFAEGRPMSGMHAIGWNSFIGAETHYTAKIAADISYQSALMVTGGVHSQRGIVPWLSMHHPAFPGGLVCVSVHFGRNSVWGGDKVNAGIVPPLFKSLYRGGVTLYGMRDELVSRFGADVANLLLHDPMVHGFFREWWGARDFAFLCDRVVLSVLDRSGGGALATLGMFSPTTVSTLETARYNQLPDTEQFNKAIDEGIERTRADNYTGGGGLVPQTPDQIVPELSSSMTGLVVKTADSDPFNPTAPVGAPFEADTATLERLAAGVDTDILERTAAQEIADRTRAALEAEGPVVGRDAKTLAERIADPTLRQGLQDKVAATYLASLSQSSDLAPLVERLGVRGVLPLSALTLAAPLVERMSAPAGGTSYLVATVQHSVLEAKAHELAQSAGEIQQRLSQASQLVTETSGELQTRQMDLTAAQHAVEANPTDASAVERRDALRQEVADLARGLAKEQEKEREAEREREAHAAEVSATAEERREAERYAEAHRADIYRGEHHGAGR
jgi:hypothetical protein